jgi:hypothetical protein
MQHRSSRRTLDPERLASGAFAISRNTLGRADGRIAKVGFIALEVGLSLPIPSRRFPAIGTAAANVPGPV